MASTISWLDASTAEQNRMREILGFFTEKDSREELGLGQIRDALGDGLFPGSSTLHTRARYLLFIPWIFRQVAHRGGNIGQTRRQELELIKALKAAGGRQSGIIGYEAGSTLKTVPSALYWSALGVYRILAEPGLTREQAVSLHGTRTPAATEEAGEQAYHAWHTSLPPAPPGFPGSAPGGMDLTYEEAEWLRERIISSVPDSMLAHLVMHQLNQETSVPWEEPEALSVRGEPQRILHHARRFSDTMQGAQLLYNILIAESYERARFDRQQGRIEHFEGALARWGEFYANAGAADWDLDDFFACVTAIRGARVSAGSEVFVRDWVAMLEASDPQRIAAEPQARALVRDRERRNKGPMARIDNPKRLASWGGSSGAGRYVYRWGYVRTILTDIHRGLTRGDQPGGTAPQVAMRQQEALGA